MASLVFILGSVCVDLYRIGCVFVHSGGSLTECWNFITDQRQLQLTDLYLKRLAQGGRGCDIPVAFSLRSYLDSGHILLEMLQREPTDDEMSDFVDLGVTNVDAIEWHPVPVRFLFYFYIFNFVVILCQRCRLIELLLGVSYGF